MVRAEGGKKPLQIGVMLRQIEAALQEYPQASLQVLFQQGYNSSFEILVACMISIRTRDETTTDASLRLFDRARTPEQVSKLTAKEIAELIKPCAFYEGKAAQILAIAQQAVSDYAGAVPCRYETLTSFRGVGPKCAHLTLGIACGQLTGVGVDIHVHRITNRWGYVETKTAEKTMEALQARLPKQHRLRINASLVPFGKHICTAGRPRCSACPVVNRCRQIGVEEHR